MENDLEKLSHPPYARHEFDPISAAVHPSGEAFACAGGTVVNIRSCRNGSVTAAAPLLEPATAVAFTSDGKKLLVGSRDARVQGFDTGTLAPIANTPALYDEIAAILAFGPSHFAAVSSRGEVNVYDNSTMSLVARGVPPDLEDAAFGGAAATADGSHVFLAGGQKIQCVETRSWKVVWTHQRRSREDPAGRIALAPDLSWLAVASRDGVAIHDARTGRLGPSFAWTCAESVRWPGHDYGEWAPRPVFAAAGGAVLVNDRVGNLVRIDARALSCPTTAPRQPGLAWICELTVLPDGAHMLVTGTDNSASIWQIEPLVGRMSCRAVDALPPSAYERLYRVDDDDYDDEDYDDEDYDDEDYEEEGDEEDGEGRAMDRKGRSTHE